MAKRLTIEVLGPPRIALHGNLVTGFTYHKVLALLIYLAVEAERAHEREMLVGLLWPHQPEAAARTNLRQALAKLREALGDETAAPPFLLTTRDTVQFNPASDCELDLAAFAPLLDQCRQHPHRGLDRCAVCAARLEHGAALYRGPFLSGFSLADSAPFEEWAILKREQLHWRAQESLGWLAASYERRGDNARAQHFARRQIELDPWHEEAHRKLMHLLAQAGQRSAALAQFEAGRRALAEGLDAAPGSETLALYQRIRSGEETPAPARPLPNWPHPASPLVGRAAEVAQLISRLADPACRLLTLTGPGGIGKTRLALTAASELAWTYTHGAAFVALAPIAAAENLSSALAQAVGVSLSGSAEPLEQVTRALQEREMLLVLDNFEQLLVPATGRLGDSRRASLDWLAELLARLPRAQFIVTSRERLNLPGEWVLPVPGLAYPQGEPPPTGFEAADFFVQCARRVNPTFELTAEEQPSVARICQLVGGLPLALELAAAWTRVITCAEIAAELEQGLGLLAEGGPGTNERRRSLEAVFDHSWRLLTAEEQAAFRGLAVFRGGFEREAAEAVAEVSLPHLTTLTDKSLVQRPAARRFDLHPLSQQYARERLRAAGAEAALRCRHAAYYLELAKTAEAGLRGSQQQAWLERLDAELGNLRAALANSLELDPETGAQLGGALWRFWQLRGLLREGQAWLRRAETQPGISAAARAQALRGAAALAWQQGDFSQARRLAEESVRLWRAEGNPTGLGEALMIYGMAAGYQGDHAAAEGALEESVELFRASANTWGLALALFYSADSEAAPRPPEAARQRLEESLRLFQQAGDQWGQALPLHGLGYTAYQQGDYAAARVWLAEALTLRRAIGDRRLIAQTLNILGEVARSEGDYARAETCYHESLDLYRALDAPGRVAMAQHNLAYGAHRRGDEARASALFAQSLAAFRVLGDLWGAAACLEGLAAVQPEPRRAARLLGAAESLREATHAHAMPADRLEYERSLATLRVRLAPADLLAAWAEGRRLTLDAAAEEAATAFAPPLTL